ncbi:RING finger protein 32 [Liparis tanakae]|uniref:RING finger protein 32 n=1 Tax=Liparis tanakae TaxID=230148 RepID=A0A4Z2I7E9_9TELE|nr:RING finger protein 32 [Liparis tanakae]
MTLSVAPRELCDIHTVINALRQTDIISVSPCILCIYAVIKGSLDSSWLSTLHHLWHLLEKKALQLTTVLHISILVRPKRRLMQSKNGPMASKKLETEMKHLRVAAWTFITQEIRTTFQILESRICPSDARRKKHTALSSRVFSPLDVLLYADVRVLRRSPPSSPGAVVLAWLSSRQSSGWQSAQTGAQKLGLVASPAGRLTEDEWARVKARSVQQGDSAQPCAICREEFCLQPQVLLSCSHVFHRACLRAFERFSGRRCCPMCRKEPYEARVIHDAARLFRHRIQARWRGYVARKRYRKLRNSIGPKDKQLRRKYFEAKLQELNDSFVRYCRTDTEAFLTDINRSLSSSRRVFRQLERKRVSEPEERDWDRIQSQVVQRGVWDCPICLTALCSLSLPPGGGPSSHRPRRRTALLSCSHLFHELCLEAFEAFSIQSRPSCPLCRSVYHKKLI